ncbi:hypothetical protein [Bacillus sp. RO1]|nr:hypothetical protein [Bacillus sp. RO1]
MSRKNGERSLHKAEEDLSEQENGERSLHKADENLSKQEKW